MSDSGKQFRDYWELETEFLLRDCGRDCGTSFDKVAHALLKAYNDGYAVGIKMKRTEANDTTNHR